MAYVATRGGENAIQQAERLFHDLRGNLSGEYVRSLVETLPYLLDRVMGEASLYAPELAALAIAQSGGDLYEAVLLLRAYRSTQPRLAYAKPILPEAMMTVRRISAAFKDIPGGQVLGPTLDYSHRLLNMAILESTAEQKMSVEAADIAAVSTYPRVADWQRSQGLVAPLPAAEAVDPQQIPDVTRDPIMFPAPRAHRLQSLARADTGGTLSLGYASMRGYGLTHPTVNEVRLAYANVEIKHPYSGVEFTLGRVRVSQAEVVSTGGGTPEQPGLELGFSATLGWNEVKVIAASMLDQEMGKPNPHPAHKEEFVLYHTEPVESSGFCIHYKLPHYVTFASSMDSIRDVREAQTRRMHEGIFVQTLLAPHKQANGVTDNQTTGTGSVAEPVEVEPPTIKDN